MFAKQFFAIQAKNWTINLRAREYLRQNIAVIILAVFIIVSQRTNPNSFTTPFYLAIAVAGYSRTLAVWWLQEKESQQKQLQKIMGLSQLSYLLSWLLYFVLNGLIVSTVLMLIVRAFVITDSTRFAEGYTFWDLAGVYFLFTISTIGYVLLACCFFSKAKTGSQAVTFIQLIVNFLYFLRFDQDLANNKLFITFLSLFPQMSFNMTVSQIAFVGGSTFDFSFNQGVITLLILGPVYILLALYLGEVIPNENGTHKHPLFFLGIGFKTQPTHLHQPLLEHQGASEQESSAKFEEAVRRQSRPVITLKNVSKSFGDQKVIDDLSLNFYGGEIFCLLGHNGAGKSTTINLLTGLLQASSGSIEVLGLKYPNDVDLIRRDIGLCLQYNVLYDNLTVQEHLRFYYRIKHQDSTFVEQQINRTILDCALDQQRGKLSKNLSGGNKRKLCLANSLIGGSRVVFLDEPSSGLDPNSRQAIWDILKNISRQQRCIILTTHHLQEAQQLSKRIAIMSKGKLIILGSTDFITDKFSVGYHAVVTLAKDNPNAADKCRQIISNQLAKCTEDKQTAKNTLKFVLPLSQVPYFAKTFKALQDAKVGMVSVYMSNLEDAFVKIGEEEDNFTEGFQKMGQKQVTVNYSGVQENDIKEDAPMKEQQMTLPQVQSRYSYCSQFRAVFFKKFRTVLRSFSTVVSVIMPAAFMSIGVLVVCVAIKNDGSDPKLDQVRLFILSYFMVWAFIFNTSTYCGSIVLERQNRFKYLSNVSGTRQLPFWTANYAFDLIIFLVPLAAFFIVVLAIGQQGKFITRFALDLIALLLLFALSFISYSYLFSFVFQKATTAYRFFPFINLVFFYFVPLIPSLVNSGGILAQYIMPFLTPFVAFSTFFTTEQIMGPNNIQDLVPSQFFVPFLALILQTIVYWFFVLFLQNMRFSLKTNPNEQLQQQILQNQNQINRRASEVQDSLISCPIKIDHLTKIYGNGKLAISNNSFSVGEGQIFGLLGPNGAGKSTSFNIITAALPKSSGSVKLFGEEVNRGIMRIFEQVGVCPQYNPIYENLTVREHLQYFALVKGIPNHLLHKTIDFYVDLLSLNSYVNVRAGVLSGGNKRKMCVAMAMIGNPQVAFFDQPSAGVDPISRRYLWKCLATAAYSKKASMILTTHSMNEAESLCSRIGILIKGSFVCLDTPKALKEQYGKGYRINVLAPIANHQEIEKAVQGQFKEAVVEKVVTDPERLVFVIKTEQFCLWQAFELFENKLNRTGMLKRYQIKQSTLEEVFIQLSRLQPVVEEQLIGQPWQMLCWQWGGNGCQLLV